MSAPLDLVIVGAGFSGLAMAIRADRAGFSDFLILEKADGVGGTWHQNTYPGAGSDIPSHLYSLSFAGHADWTRLYPRQPEIASYLRGLVDRCGLASRLRLDTAVSAARWDAAARLWRVETERGALAARMLVLGLGPLHRPALPDLPGLDAFEGASFHSARWDHACALEGKRVAVIGTGASAVQFVPEIAGRVARLTVFQRSAPWVLPRGDRPHGPRERALFAKAPLARHLYRQWIFWRHEIAALLGFTRVSPLTTFGERLAQKHLAAAIRDPALRAALTPDYRFGCKRVLISDDFYPALARPNVAVVTAPTKRIAPRAVVTGDGAAHPADVLILATGFDTTGHLPGLDIAGRDGVRLAQAWREGADAHLGVSVHGFPNLFLLMGPNTLLGHNSVLPMAEAQVAHVLGALRLLRGRPGASLEVRADVQARFRAETDAALGQSVWSRGGCASWYRDAAGRNRMLWPGTVPAYLRRTRRLRPSDYVMRQAAAAAAVTG